jgi:hypothetical protein
MSSKCWDTTRKSKIKYPGKPYIINLVKGESKWGLIPNDFNPLPIGEEAHFSNSRKGTIYYANSEQKKSQWAFPTEKDPELPENWEIRKSSDCNQIYYYDIINRKTQWNFPKTPIITESTQYVDGRELLRQEA